ncbi:hypothetical protein I5677_06040 [Mobilitalea sibirica]|uniref:Uncharacterized protein n=1 Tax=Mobilitalea sibirica TaxID=1462919 RepID=A0A8J7H1S7_9FIRM|nr:hypothetical protein [Mobilitalea sibirica]MBH1940457.1 hypothetical protein [Mobilitalea sibirica]
MPKQTRLSEDAEIYQINKDKNEKERFRDLSFKKKISYLWEYYRLHALFTIIIFGFLGYTIYTISKPNIEAKLYTAIINNTIDDVILDEYKAEFTDLLQLDPEKEEVIINSKFYFNGSYDYAMNMRQILVTYTHAQEIDIIIAPKSEFEGYAYNGFFYKLSDQLPTDLYSMLTDQFYLSDMEDDPQENVYGIYLTESDLFQNHAVNNDPYILGIVGNSKNRENAIEFIRFLFEAN